MTLSIGWHIMGKMWIHMTLVNTCLLSSCSDSVYSIKHCHGPIVLLLNNKANKILAQSKDVAKALQWRSLAKHPQDPYRYLTTCGCCKRVYSKKWNRKRNFGTFTVQNLLPWSVGFYRLVWFHRYSVTRYSCSAVYHCLIKTMSTSFDSNPNLSTLGARDFRSWFWTRRLIGF